MPKKKRKENHRKEIFYRNVLANVIRMLLADKRKRTPKSFIIFNEIFAIQLSTIGCSRRTGKIYDSKYRASNEPYI